MVTSVVCDDIGELRYKLEQHFLFHPADKEQFLEGVLRAGMHCHQHAFADALTTPSPMFVPVACRHRRAVRRGDQPEGNTAAHESSTAR